MGSTSGAVEAGGINNRGRGRGNGAINPAGINNRGINNRGSRGRTSRTSNNRGRNSRQNRGIGGCNNGNQTMNRGRNSKTEELFSLRHDKSNFFGRPEGLFLVSGNNSSRTHRNRRMLGMNQRRRRL
jgi:hypothetical protein